MANIQDVAKRAGVSIATVSRAINFPGVVAFKTRERVGAAIAALGYAPNAAAKSLRTSRSTRIIVTVPDIANPFFSEVIRGLEDAAKAEGYAVVLADTRHDPGEEERHGEMLRRHEADGLIFLGHAIPSNLIDMVHDGAGRAPIVNGCEFSPELSVPSAHIDNAQAARAMMDHLHALGHHRIGLIAGPIASPLSRDRLAGARAAAAAHGSLHDLRERVGDFSIRSGAERATELLALPQRPTALFCFSDEMALGALHAIHKAGLRVPDDISVAGFDGIRFGQYAIPSLTTVHQPADAIGRETVNLLMAILRGGVAPASITLPHTITVRESTGPCPQSAPSRRR